ncbi:MAG: urea carboxylase-associated family protein [Alphaproteobacteria bacterium]|nr:urea carboxylase-associated family protein [Alphaproteobacteria bacterium]
MSDGQTTIPARKGKAARLVAGQSVRVINTPGSQVVDTWAFVDGDMTEFMSMEHSRASMNRLTPKIGDTLVTNHRRPILTLVEDTSGEIHDTFIAACDRWRYEGLGVEGFHDSCENNLHTALQEIGLSSAETPSPLNLFMNIPWDAEGRIDWKPPVSAPGGFVVLKALIDCVVVFSSCPQDIIPINGINCTPQDAHFVVTEGAAF